MKTPPPGPTRPLRVLVTADLLAVAEAVCSALAARGLDAVSLVWPSGDTATADLAGGADTGLLLSDLRDARQVLQAVELLRWVRVRWVVQTVAPRGEAWGAMLAAGAELVVPVHLSLAEMLSVLRGDVPDGLSIPAAEREELVRAWRATEARRTDLLVRVRRLNEQEVETLQLLYAGHGVPAIARQLGVGESTVRGRVRSILTTLGVRSDLAAVAAYGELRRIVGEPVG